MIRHAGTIALALAACGSATEPVVAPTPAHAAAAAPAVAPRPGPGTLLGRWRVVGCATSPLDPADCARGEIVFEANVFTVALPCCKRSGAYSIVSSTPDRIVIATDGEHEEIRITPDGTAHWDPVSDGRVGALSFVRAVAP